MSGAGGRAGARDARTRGGGRAIASRPSLARLPSLAPLASLVSLVGLAALAALAGDQGTAATLDAHLSTTRIAAGESTTLEVVVSNASGSVADPEFAVPAGVEILGSARAQNFSWVNGKSSSQIVFRYELGADAAGRFTIGPVRVRVGSETLVSPPLALEVASGAPQIGTPPAGAAPPASDRSTPASLEVDVTPRDPWVGQPVILRVRLVQRQSLAEDPQYGPPSTTGFWAEPPSRPESYYAQEGVRRVLVTETRTRLYPLAPGAATVGPAVAQLTLASGSFDPFGWAGGGRRRVEVRSPPISVRVRALPGGAPPGFDGAVGSLTLSWGADRERTRQDVPVSVRLDVRGVGNLPMIHTPTLDPPDAEVFGGPVDDSLSQPGGEGMSRRSFRWTVLARSTGTLEIPAPPFAWFEPAAASYRRAALPALRVEVDPPAGPADAAREGFPPLLEEHPFDPGARPASPARWLLGGLLLGTAGGLWRSVRARRPDRAPRARQREALRAARLSGPDFWRVAEESAAWLESLGRPVADLRREIAAARYSPTRSDPERVRAPLIDALQHALPPARGVLAWRALAVLVGLAGVAAVALGAPRWGDERGRLAVRAADARARVGDVVAARTQWRALWDAGVHAAPLAARLAWAELRNGSIADAALWALRGARDEPRDAGLGWVWERVRESGGLVGTDPGRLPVRSDEWALGALVFGALAAGAWPRGRVQVALAMLALACALALPAQRLRDARTALAVVRTATALEGAGVDLSPGQVVRVRERQGGRVRVSAGRDLTGWLPASAIEEVR